MKNLDMSETERVYERLGLGKYKIGFGERPALLVVDFEYGLTQTQSSYGGGNIREAVEATAELLKPIRAKNIPVFFSAVAYRKDGLDAPYFIRKMPLLIDFTLGSRDVEIDPLLAPRESEFVIEKKYASFFRGTILDNVLTTLCIDTVLIAGCVTGGCVRSTAVDALAFGYRPIIVEECVGDRSLFWHKFNLFEMNAKVGDVVGMEEVIQYLETV